MALELAQIVAELVQAVGSGGEVEACEDGVVDLLGGPAANLSAAMQEDFEEADETRIVCCLIAAIMRVALETTLVSPTLRLALTTGFLGGLTTYSSFNYETTRLLQERDWGPGLLNLAVTVAVYFVAGLVGYAAAGRLMATG